MKNELLRYSCQLPLEGFGRDAQHKLGQAKVLVVGLGGLGCPVSAYLASAGVGTIGLADDDTVSLSNLHRQVLYGDSDIGKQKTRVAKAALNNQNPSVNIICHPRITFENATDIIDLYDVVVDCTDNFDSRYLLNDTCVLKNKPLVYGAIFQYEGQAAVWNVRQPDGRFSCNYRDVFPEIGDSYIPNCVEAGVIPTIAGIIGCIQATEVIKLLTGATSSLANKLMLFDSGAMHSYTVELPQTTTAEISQERQSDEIYSVSHSELTRLLANDRCQLVDVRSASEHEFSNIGGINIPLDKIISNKANINYDRPIVFYCTVGIKSMIAAKHTKRLSPQAKVMSLQGGIKD